MTKLDMINYIKDFLECNHEKFNTIGIKLVFTDEEKRLYKDIKEGHKWLTTVFEPLMLEHLNVYCLATPEIWKNYRLHDMMRDENIIEVRKMNSICKRIRAEYKKRPALFKKFKKEVIKLNKRG